MIENFKGSLKKVFSKKTFFVALGLFLFALVFVYIPYEEIRGGYKFVDLQNYVGKFSRRSYIDKHAWDSIRGMISNEVLWDMTVRYLMDALSIDSRDALRLTSFVMVLACATYVKKGAGWIWVFLLLNPLFIDFAISQCRLSFAMGILYLSLLTNKKWLVLAISMTAVFIHTAMLPIALFYWVGWSLFRFRWLAKRPLIGVCCLIGMGASLALLMGPLQHLVGGLIAEDRRVGRYVGAGSSLAFSSFWMALLPVFAFFQPKFNRVANNAFATTMLSVFVTTVIFDLYGTRFVAAAFPCIICAVYRLPKEIRNYVLSTLIAFTGVQWIMWG